MTIPFFCHPLTGSVFIVLFYNKQGGTMKVKYHGVMYTCLHNQNGNIVGIVEVTDNL